VPNVTWKHIGALQSVHRELQKSIIVRSPLCHCQGHRSRSQVKVTVPCSQSTASCRSLSLYVHRSVTVKVIIGHRSLSRTQVKVTGHRSQVKVTVPCSQSTASCRSLSLYVHRSVTVKVIIGHRSRSLSRSQLTGQGHRSQVKVTAWDFRIFRHCKVGQKRLSKQSKQKAVRLSILDFLDKRFPSLAMVKNPKIQSCDLDL